MVRLPDIGFSEWIADQQAEFQKSTAGHFDALEFRDAASQLEELIPKDFPTIGGEETWEEEQRRIQEAEQRRQEQEAAIREAQMDAAQAAWMQEQQEAEANRQRDLMMQAQKEASGYGIPTPNDVFNEFAGLEGRPLGTGHPDTSSGVFDAVDQAPPPVAPTLESISPDQAFSEFSSISPKERLLEGVSPEIGRYDFGAAASSLASIPGQISDVASSIPGQVSSAASTIWDAIPSGEQIMEMDRGIREYPARRVMEFPENAAKNASAIWESGIKPLAAPTIREAEKLSPLFEESRRTTEEADRVREAAGLPPLVDLSGKLPLQESAKTSDVREADERAVKATHELVRAGLKAPLKALADTVDAALAPAGLDRESSDISRGYGEKFGLGKIGISDAVANLSPAKALQVVQWADVAGSMFEAPAEVGTSLAALGALAAIAKKSPKTAITIVGGLAGGIDSLYNQRDVYQEGDGYDVKDTLLETAAGGMAGGAAAFGTVPAVRATSRTVANTIRAIASSPTMKDALERLDIAGGRALDLAGEGGNQAVELARKYPAVATALGITAGAAAGDAIGDYFGGDTEATATPNMGAGAVVGGMAAAGGKSGAVDAAVQAGRKLAPTFYSKLEQVLKDPKVPVRVTPTDLERIVQNNQVKAEELKWTNFDDWLQEQKTLGTGMLRKADVLDFLEQNKVDVREVELSGDRVKFPEYNEAGGSNYRELILTLPDIPPARPQMIPNAKRYHYLLAGEDDATADIAGVFPSQEEAQAALRQLPPNEQPLYRIESDPTHVPGENLPEQVAPYRDTTHWDEEQFENPIAHIRFDERVDPDGKRVLLIDEVQSQWNQTGRREGYLSRRMPDDQTFNDMEKEYYTIRDRLDQENREPTGAETRRMAKIESELGSDFDPSIPYIPEGPYQNSWQTLALRRMIRYAAENNFDRIEWWDGQPHAERWGTEEFKWIKLPDGSYSITGTEFTPVGGVNQQVAGSLRPQQEIVQSEDDVLAYLMDRFSGLELGRKEMGESKDLSAKLWKQMQEQPEGVVRPREEGLRYFYDRALPQEMNNLVKKFDKDNRVTVGERIVPKMEDFFDDDVYMRNARPSATETVARKTFGVDVTQNMKEKALFEGQPQFVALPPGLAEAGAGAAAGSQSEEDSQFSAGGALVGAALGVNMAKLPKNGPWQERLARGLEVPEGATPRIKNMLNRAYGEAMRLLEKSQTVSGASRKIRFHTMADEAYRAYEKLLTTGSPEGAARVSDTPRPLRSAPREVPAAPKPRPTEVPPREGPTPVEDDPYPFGQGDAVPAASRPVPSDQPGVAGVADEFTVDPDPLPDVLDPERVIDQTQFKTVVANLQEDMAMNPKHVQALNDAVVKIMMAPGDVKGKHVQKLVKWAGNLRALPRGMSKEDAIDQYAQTQLQKSGLISDYGSRAAPEGAAPKGWDTVGGGPGPAERYATRQTEWGDRVPLAAAANAAGGAGFGAAAGGPDQPLNERIQTAAAGAVVGAATGAAAAKHGSVAAGRLIDKLVNRGFLSESITTTHPTIPERVAAMYSLAARGLPDDAPVEPPAMVDFLLKKRDGSPMDLPGGLSRLFTEDNLTAGLVREIVSEPSVLERMGRVVSEYLTDVVTGNAARASRAKETAADAMSVRKWDSIPRINLPTRSLGEEFEVGHELGRAFRIDPMHPDATPEVIRLQEVMQDTADELGLPIPELYFTNSPRRNLALQKSKDGTATGMLVTKGVLDMLDRFTDRELQGVVAHELAHQVQPRILGMGLLGRARTSFPERDLSTPFSANAAVGAGMGAMTEDDDDSGYSWEAIAGGAVVGGLFKKKLNPQLVKDLKTIEDDLTRSFRSPNQGVSLQGPKFSERAYDFWQNANVQLFDELGKLQGFQNDLAREFLKQTGMRLPAEMLFAELKRFDFSNRAKIDATEYITYGAVKKLSEAGVPQEEFDRYLMARQNVDILRAQQADPKPPGPDSKKPYVGDLTRQFPGSSSYEAEVKYLQDAEAIHKKNGTWDAVQGAAEDVWALSGRMLDLLEGGGLIDKTLADTLRTKYPHYVPTRILEKLGDDSFTPPSKSMSIASNQIRELTLEGTSKDALNPTAAMVATLYQVHAAVQKNIVANAFVDAWDTASGRINTFDDAWDEAAKATRPPVGQFTPDLSTDVGRRIQRHLDGIQPWPNNDPAPAGWTSMTNFRNGVKEKFIVSDELAPLINFAKPDNIKVVSAAMNFFRQAVTTRNPVFLASNMFLDLSSVLIRESSRAGGPQHAGGVFKEWFNAMLEFVVSPAAWADMGEGRYSGDMARALMQGGGMSGGYFPGGIQPAKKIGVIDWIDGKPEDIDAMLKKYNLRDPRSPIVKEVENMRRGAIEINTAGGVARMMKDMLTFKPVETIGERIEAVPRVAAMRLSEKRIDNTLSLLQQERARTVKAISGLDQSPGSGIGQKLKDLGVRSLDSIDAEIKDTEARRIIEGTQAYRTTTLDFNKGGTFSRFVNQIVPFFNVGMQSIADVPRAFAENKVGYPATVITGVTLPVILAEEWNNMDEQRAKDYADIPAHIKDQGLVVMLPGEAPVDEKGNRMPRYFHLRYRQLAFVAALTREMLQKTWYREQLPAENEQRGWGEVAGSAMSMVSPVPVDDSAEFAVGLVPPILGTHIQAALDRDLFREKRIVSQFADDRASPLSKAVYEYLDKPESLRPSMVEFITRDAGGGYAKFWHGVANMLDGRKSMGVTGITPIDAFADRFVKSGGGGKSQIAREHLLTPSAEQLLKKHNVSWRPSPVDYKIGDVPLTLSEYGDYQREVNIAVDKTIQDTARKADFLVKSPGEKEAMLERSVGFAKEAVRNKFLSRIPTAERAKRRKLEDEKEKKGWTGIWSDPPSTAPSSTSGSSIPTQRSAPARSGPIIPATRP
jgi:hypothetical protein